MTYHDTKTFRFRHDYVLGTVAEVGIATHSEENAQRIDQLIVDVMSRLQSTFSIFEPASELCEYQRTGKATNTDLLAVLALAEHWRGASNGAFHPGMDPLRRMWAQGAEANVAPSSAELAVTVAAMADRPRHEHSNLNAIAKGWIADRAVDAAMSEWPREPHAPKSVWLSIGGDLVHKGDGSARVGIEDPYQPFDNVAPLTVVPVSNQALATSGNARRRVTIAGRTYGHVLDPRTGMPVGHIASASIIAPDAATADVLATIAAVLTPAESVEIVEQTTGAACLLIDAHGAIMTSERWPASDG